MPIAPLTPPQVNNTDVKGSSNLNKVKAAAKPLKVGEGIKMASLTEFYLTKQAAAVDRGFGAAYDIIRKGVESAPVPYKFGAKVDKYYKPALKKAWNRLSPGRKAGVIAAPTLATGIGVGRLSKGDGDAA